MIDPQELHRKSETLSELLREKLGLRARSLSAQLEKAGRLLPRRLKRAKSVILKAERHAEHPKLALTVEPGAVDTAFADITVFLDEIDPADRRKGKILGWLGAVVFNLIVVLALLVGLLMWQDLI